jgi:hypothetical protein
MDAERRSFALDDIPDREDAPADGKVIPGHLYWHGVDLDVAHPPKNPPKTAFNAPIQVYPPRSQKPASATVQVYSPAQEKPATPSYAPGEWVNPYEEISAARKCGVSEDSGESREALYASAVDAMNKRNFPKAVCLAEAAAALGNPAALTVLGVVYWQDDNPAFDLSQSFKYFKEAATKGDPFGEMHLSECFANGIGTNSDLGAAIYWAGQARQDPEVRAFMDANRQTMQDDYDRNKAEEEENKRQNDKYRRPCEKTGGCVVPAPH